MASEREELIKRLVEERNWDELASLGDPTGIDHQDVYATEQWKSIVSLGEPVVMPLIGALESGKLDDYHAGRVIAVLESIKDVRAIKPLVQILEDLESRVEPRRHGLPGAHLDAYRRHQCTLLWTIAQIAGDSGGLKLVAAAENSLTEVSKPNRNAIVSRALTVAGKVPDMHKALGDQEADVRNEVQDTIHETTSGVIVESSTHTVAREQAKDTETLPLVTAICPKCGKTNTGTTALYHCQRCGQNLHEVPDVGSFIGKVLRRLLRLRT